MGTIRDEIRQKRPFAPAADEAVVTLLGPADRVRSALSVMVEAHGITLQAAWSVGQDYKKYRNKWVLIQEI